MSEISSSTSTYADCPMLSTLPWSSTKCNDATARHDRAWNVSGFRSLSVSTKLIRYLKGWWRMSENYLSTLVHSTSPSIKVREPCPCRLYTFDALSGTMDAMMTTKGDVWVTTVAPSAHSFSSSHILGPTRAGDTGLQPGSR